MTEAVSLARHSAGDWHLVVAAEHMTIDLPLSAEVEAELEAFYGENVWRSLTHDDALVMRHLVTIEDRAAFWSAKATNPLSKGV